MRITKETFTPGVRKKIFWGTILIAFFAYGNLNLARIWLIKEEKCYKIIGRYDLFEKLDIQNEFGKRSYKYLDTETYNKYSEVDTFCEVGGYDFQDDFTFVQQINMFFSTVINAFLIISFIIYAYRLLIYSEYSLRKFLNWYLGW